MRLASVSNMPAAIRPADAKAKADMLHAFADHLDDEEAEVNRGAYKGGGCLFRGWWVNG